MEFRSLYRLHPPTAFLENPIRLIRRQYSVFIDADAHRTIWIASRFCCGLNRMSKARRLLRLIQEGLPEFELIQGSRQFRFQVVEGYEEPDKEAQASDRSEARLKESCITALKEALGKAAHDPRPEPASLVCFVHLTTVVANEETIDSIARGIDGAGAGTRQIWLFLYDEKFEGEQSRQSGEIREKVYPFALFKLCPHPDPPCLFEIDSLLKEIMVFRTVLIVVGIFVLLGMLQIYFVISKNASGDPLSYFKEFVFPATGHPHQLEY